MKANMGKGKEKVALMRNGHYCAVIRNYCEKIGFKM
jgi:hypothetical protein